MRPWPCLLQREVREPRHLICEARGAEGIGPALHRKENSLCSGFSLGTFKRFCGFSSEVVPDAMATSTRCRHQCRGGLLGSPVDVSRHLGLPKGSQAVWLVPMCRPTAVAP